MFASLHRNIRCFQEFAYSLIIFMEFNAIQGRTVYVHSVVIIFFTNTLRPLHCSLSAMGCFLFSLKRDTKL